MQEAILKLAQACQPLEKDGVQNAALLVYLVYRLFSLFWSLKGKH